MAVLTDPGTIFAKPRASRVAPFLGQPPQPPGLLDVPQNRASQRLLPTTASASCVVGTHDRRLATHRRGATARRSGGVCPRHRDHRLPIWRKPPPPRERLFDTGLRFPSVDAAVLVQSTPATVSPNRRGSGAKACEPPTTSSCLALTTHLSRMCNLAGGAMQKATQALLRADLDAAEQVIGDQDRTAALSAQARQDAFDLLALQQPSPVICARSSPPSKSSATSSRWWHSPCMWPRSRSDAIPDARCPMRSRDASRKWGW